MSTYNSHGLRPFPMVHQYGEECAFEDGQYCAYDAKKGKILEDKVWILKRDLREYEAQLYVILSSFSKAAERAKVGVIVSALRRYRDAPFSRTTRFPPEGTYVNIDSGEFTTILTELAGASSFSDKDDERTNTIDNTPAGQIKANFKPNSTDKKDWNYDNAVVAFKKNVEALSHYTDTDSKVYDRIGFESKHNLVWSCKGCCVKAACIEDCETKYRHACSYKTTLKIKDDKGKNKDPNMYCIQDSEFDTLMNILRKNYSENINPKRVFLNKYPFEEDNDEFCDQIQKLPSLQELKNSEIHDKGYLAIAEPEGPKYNIFTYHYSFHDCSLDGYGIKHICTDIIKKDDIEQITFVRKNKNLALKDLMIVLEDNDINLSKVYVNEKKIHQTVACSPDNRGIMDLNSEKIWKIPKNIKLLTLFVQDEFTTGKIKSHGLLLDLNNGTIDVENTKEYDCEMEPLNKENI